MVSTPRGIKYPTPEDKIKDGVSPSALADDFAELATSTDAAITAGVQEAKGEASDQHDALALRVTAVEEKNFVQDTRLLGVEEKNNDQDGRLEGLENLQPVKSVRLEAGKWVWDPEGTPTHYVLIAHDGKPTVRTTPWPTPNPSTPSFNW